MTLLDIIKFFFEFQGEHSDFLRYFSFSQDFQWVQVRLSQRTLINDSLHCCQYLLTSNLAWLKQVMYISSRICYGSAMHLLCSAFKFSAALQLCFFLGDLFCVGQYEPPTFILEELIQYK